MNLFVTDEDPVVSAIALADKHVVKMVLEATQTLSTICGGPYKPSHGHHPITIWAGATSGNFNWVREHGLALAREYTHRYGKRHATETILESFRCSVSSGERQEFYGCMPEEFKGVDVVTSYRLYLKWKYSNWDKAVWTSRQPPTWLLT